MNRTYDVVGGKPRDAKKLRYFSFWVPVSQFCGIAAVVLVAIYMNNYHGGMKGGIRADNFQVIRFHPFFMGIGMIFLQGEAILVYRLFRHEHKLFSKLLHLLTHLGAFVCAVLGLVSIFSFKELIKQRNLTTAHSWIGMGVCVCFVLQYAAGFVVFFFPQLSPRARERVLPAHRFFGCVVFVATCANALAGVAQIGWIPGLRPCRADPTDVLCGEQLIMNFLGLSIFGYCASVVYLVVDPGYRRAPLPGGD